MKKRIIIGNWKMSPQTLAEARVAFLKIKKTCKKLRRTQAVICPPFVYLHSFKALVSKQCMLGAQDLFWEREGAYTGEISAGELVDAGARFVIIGHSERRALGETDEDAAKKISAAVREYLLPVLCVGEADRDERGEYTKYIVRQVRHGLRGLKREHLSRIHIAYEPIWAIGARARHAASPDDVFEVSILIRKTLAGMYGKESAENATLLYGGSVDEKNTKEFLEKGGMRGLLIGRASIDPKTFSRILMSAEER